MKVFWTRGLHNNLCSQNIFYPHIKSKASAFAKPILPIKMLLTSKMQKNILELVVYSISHYDSSPSKINKQPRSRKNGL